jgi:HSP20 family protein
MKNALVARVNHAVDPFANLWNNWEETFAPSRFNVDIKDGADAVTLIAEVPGIPKENIDISVENGMLSIKTQCQQQSDKVDESYVVRERRCGSAVRSFRITDDLDPQSITAELKDGLLKLTVKKNEKNQLRRIAIQ